jgi:hypothetical protein
MQRFFESLRPFIRLIVRRAGWVLVLATLLAAAGLWSAQNLTIDTDFSKLIPQDYPSVQALETLRETVGGESDVAVGIVSPSFEANKAFAEDLIPKALDLKREQHNEPYLTRVEYRRDTEFLENNALYFATQSELDQVEQFLNDQIEDAKLEANPFYFDLDEEESDTDSTAQELDQVYNRLVGTEYPVSDDSTTMVLRFYPAGSQTNIGFIEQLYDDLEQLVARMDPQAYHPDMEVTLAGRLLRQQVEIQAIQSDVLSSFGTGVSTVILVVVLYFLYKSYRARTAGGSFSRRALLTELVRAPAMALVIAVPLLMSLAWTFGIAYLAFETLNLMTATLGLVLFGLGIDFGIHFYGRYAEERAERNTVMKAAETTFTSTGQAITVGALTTAAALFVLTAADFKGFSEFGFIAGIGVLFALGAMTIVMPALLAVFERTGLLNLTASAAVPANGGGDGRSSFPAARRVVIGGVVAVIAALVLLPRASFEYDFGALEPEYEAYEVKDDVIDRVSTQSVGRNPAYIVTDTPEEAAKVAEAVRAKAAADTTSPTIQEVQTLQERFPLRDSAKQAKLERIADIRSLLNGKYLQNETSEDIERLRRAAQTRTPITIDQVPEYLRKRFTTKSGEVGTFVMIYPSVGLSDGRQSIAFAEDVGTIRTADGEVYHAGSTSLVAADMLRLMRQEAPWMVGGTFLIVALLMMINFGSIRWAGLALIPLVVGVLWMLLVLELVALKLNFYNLVVLPAVLGIGNDAGVHLVHRYREEGVGSIRRVLRSTGEHVTMGSLTTMIGFGGLLLSFHPGLRSIGELAVVGIGMTLLAALLFLPALLQWIEDQNAIPADAGNGVGTGESAALESEAAAS